MPDGFKIASAYVSVTAQADESSGTDAGKVLSDAAKAGAGKVTIQAQLDAAQVRIDAQKAADEAKAKVQFDAAIDAAQLQSEEDRAAAEAK